MWGESSRCPTLYPRQNRWPIEAMQFAHPASCRIAGLSVARPAPIGGGFAATAIRPAFPRAAANETSRMRAGRLAVPSCLDAIDEHFADAGGEHLRFLEG